MTKIKSFKTRKQRKANENMLVNLCNFPRARARELSRRSTLQCSLASTKTLISISQRSTPAFDFNAIQH